MKATITFKRYIKNDPLLMKEIWFNTFGTKYWYLNGLLHREDGPAAEYWNGTKRWRLNGKDLFSEKDYLEALKEYKLNKSKQTF